MNDKLDAAGMFAAIRAHQGVDPGRLDWATMRNAGIMPQVMLLENDFDARLRSVGNTLAQMCNAVETDEQIRTELQRLSAALSYLLNSSSFDAKTYHDFDKREIDRKIGRTK